MLEHPPSSSELNAAPSGLTLEDVALIHEYASLPSTLELAGLAAKLAQPVSAAPDSLAVHALAVFQAINTKLLERRSQIVSALSDSALDRLMHEASRAAGNSPENSQSDSVSMLNLDALVQEIEHRRARRLAFDQPPEAAKTVESERGKAADIKRAKELFGERWPRSQVSTAEMLKIVIGDDSTDELAQIIWEGLHALKEARFLLSTGNSLSDEERRNDRAAARSLRKSAEALGAAAEPAAPAFDLAGIRRPVSAPAESLEKRMDRARRHRDLASSLWRRAITPSRIQKFLGSFQPGTKLPSFLSADIPDLARKFREGMTFKQEFSQARCLLSLHEFWQQYGPACKAVVKSRERKKAAAEKARSLAAKIVNAERAQNEILVSLKILLRNQSRVVADGEKRLLRGQNFLRILKSSGSTRIPLLAEKFAELDPRLAVRDPNAPKRFYAERTVRECLRMVKAIPGRQK